MKSRISIAVFILLTLSSCIPIVLPDYSRSETIMRLQAIHLMDLKNQKAVYFLNKCIDRSISDKEKECSLGPEGGGQFLTVQAQNWVIDRKFLPSKEDFKLPNDDKYFVRYEIFAPPATRDIESSGVLVGDFVQIDLRGAHKKKAKVVRVWLQTTPAIKFFVFPDPSVTFPPDDAPGLLKLWPMNPTLTCREIDIKYRIDAMLAPMPMISDEYKLGNTHEESCTPL